SKSADDDRVQGSQLLNKTFTEIPAIRCNTPDTDNTDDLFLFQIHTTGTKKQYRAIHTMFQSIRIIFILKIRPLNTVILYKAQFSFRRAKVFRPSEVFCQISAHPVYLLQAVLPFFKDSPGTSAMGNKFFSGDVPDLRGMLQSQDIK